MSMNFCVRNVAAGQRELHAGEQIAIRRNIAGRVAGAARQSVQYIVANSGWRRAELVHIAHQIWLAEYLP